MTPEGRQQIEHLIKEWRGLALDNKIDAEDEANPALGRVAASIHEACANDLEALLVALLLAEAHPQVQEKKEDTDTRVEDTQYQEPLATASENTLGPTIRQLQTGACNLSKLRAIVDAGIEDWRKQCGTTGIPNGYAGTIAAHLWTHLQAELLAAAPDVAEGDRSMTPNQGRHDDGDVPENTTDNPRSWIAWKRRALAAEAKLSPAPPPVTPTEDQT